MTMTAQQRADRVAIVEDDLALGIGPDRIAAGFGIKRDSLGRFLDRQGRHDLAVHIYETRRLKDHYSQGRTCADCGQPCSNGCERCRRCANSRRAYEMWESRSPWKAA